ncbi:hypothetical protein [Pseudorhizobium flavum]|uniref:hypothetical protein n=1 Tax=Pseudorhizobium flavum TaxID=1335061 RepID=UPI0037701DF5
MDISDKVTIRAYVEYETREHCGAGRVHSGYIVNHANRVYLGIATPAEEPGLRIEIGGLTNFPALLASLTLVEPDEENEESPDDFNQRLKMRDDLAKALEDAAARLRQAALK